MALQFVPGNSGAGKSFQLYQKILQEAGIHPERKYLVIVPEQFTMQTQKELVALSPRHGKFLYWNAWCRNRRKSWEFWVAVWKN